MISQNKTWKKDKLGNISLIIMGQSPPSNTYNTSGIGLPFFQGKTEFSDKYPKTLKWCSQPNKIAEPNDILITVRAPVGALNIANQKCCIGRGIAAIRTKENSEFLWYYLQFIQPELSKKGTGTIFAGISAQVLRDIEIPLPSLAEQTHIVELFVSIENSIVLLQEQTENLTSLRKKLVNDLLNANPKFGNLLTIHDYEKIKFEKIASNISERVDPKDTSLDIYVGLEHLDSDDLVIRRKGKPADVIGTKLKIYNGDIIFGKRRAYLRKVAVADFDGIVSAHSMVLRANEKFIEKDFLPFFMQSDEFMNRAIQISEGSLSPTIKWNTLARQEFLLPKQEKQGKLIEVFQQFDHIRELLKSQILTLKALKQKLLNEILS